VSKSSSFLLDDTLNNLVDDKQEASNEDKRVDNYMLARDKTRKNKSMYV